MIMSGTADYIDFIQQVIIVKALRITQIISLLSVQVVRTKHEALSYVCRSLVRAIGIEAEDGEGTPVATTFSCC